MGGIETADEDEVPTTSGRQDAPFIFVLENASLETAHVGKKYQLLNSDDHAKYLLRHDKDPAEYRPDIVHQALLAILDSPLNKAGKIKVVYVHTARNVLIEVNPQVRLPRTFKRFAGLMIMLLQKLSIRASNGSQKLLKVVKGPVTRYFPAGAQRVGFSHKSDSVVPLQSFVKTLLADSPVVFAVGGMAKGKIQAPYSDSMVSISEYPLSAACCIGKITNALEAKLVII